MLENLSQTVPEMCSNNYVDRFIAEYEQLSYRLDKLSEMIDGYQLGTLGFEPKCSLALLMEQHEVMKDYKRILEKRAEIEGIPFRTEE